VINLARCTDSESQNPKVNSNQRTISEGCVFHAGHVKEVVNAVAS